MINKNFTQLITITTLLIYAISVGLDIRAASPTPQELQAHKKLLIANPFENNGHKRPLRQQKQCSSMSNVVTKSSPTQSSNISSMLPKDASLTRLLSQPAQTIGLNFTAATQNDGLWPFLNLPNQNGWVGPQQYILMSFGTIRSFNKFTGQPDGILNIDAGSFFNVSTSDVRIDYSRTLDRWFMSCENFNTNVFRPTDLLVAWSDSGIITSNTVWTLHTFTNAQLIPENTPGPEGAIDYNQLATDANAVYISLDTFDGTTSNYLGTSLVVIPNSSFIAGNPFDFTIIPGILPGPNPTNFGEFTPPADNFDTKSTFGYLIHASSDFYPSGNTFNQLFLYRIINPGSNNPTLSVEIPIDVPTYASPANAPHKGNLYNVLLGGVNGGYLQTGIFGALEAPHVRNKQLYACHAIQVDSTGTGTASGDRVGVRWYQFDLTGDPTGQGQGNETATTAPALVQFGTLFDSSASDPLFYYIPSIMTNKNADLVIEGTVSGNNAYTNVFYAGRKATDPLGTLRDPVLVTNNMSNPHNLGPLVNPANGNIGHRWGDESSLCPDPTNDLDIWSTGQWAALVNSYGTQVTQLIPAS